MSDYIISRAILRVKGIYPGLSKKDLKILLKILLQSAAEELSSEGKVKLQGIGVISLCKSKGFNSRSLSGEIQEIPDRVRVKFRPAQKLKSRAKEYIIPDLDMDDLGLESQCTFCHRPSDDVICDACKKQLKGD